MDMQAFDLVQQLSASQYLVRSLHVVAELGVADAVDDAGRSVTDVAAEVGADADALRRVLRLLESRGIFRLDGDIVAHSPASQLLHTEHPASLASFVLMFAQQLHWQSAELLMHSVRTGQAAADVAFPDGGPWGYFTDRPDEGTVFGQAMAAKSAVQIADVLTAHDFGAYRRIVDVGAGEGHLLRAVTAAHPAVTGVVFDLPAVVAAARQAGPDERLEFVAGDFFTTDLPSGDAIVLMEVLHDWDDAHCATILDAVRRTAAPDTKLVIIEIEMTDDKGPTWPKLLDIVMLAQFAARQRTNAEYTHLLEANGYTVTAQTSTPAGMTVIEASLN